MQIAQTAERFFTLNNQYSADRAGLAFPLPTNQSPRSGAAKYNISIAFPTPQTYILQAVPAGSQVSDVCGTLQINQLGVTTPDSGTDGGPCW
jgi:type IV pilus assembly protein PilE